MTRGAAVCDPVVARRTFAVPRERVFLAFTDPRQLARWFSPGDDVGARVLEFDLRPGGAYRLAFDFPDGRTDIVVGQYREIAPNERLIYTWTWEPPDPFAGVESLVTVEISDSRDGASVVVTHERLPSDERRRVHDVGWGETLSRLARFIQLVSEQQENT